MTDIQTLVKQCLRNNAAAQKQLYDAYAPVMLGICYRYTKRMEDAHDVLQEGFIRVFRKLEQWKGEGELGGWIRRIMVNTALNWLRDHQSIRWETDDLGPHENSTPDPHTAIEHLQAKELADIIRRLPAGYQTVFNLHAIEGYSHVEIGKMLGIADGTSRSQYLRARQLMMGWLAEDYPEKNALYAGRK